MSEQMTFEDLLSTTSLPVAGCGALPSGLPDGQTIDQSGPPAAPVRRSQRPEKRKPAQIAVGQALCRMLDELESSYAAYAATNGLPTPGTYTRNFGDSQETLDQRQSLVNRLRARTDVLGSQLYALRWKSCDMPIGPPIPRLAATALRTSGKGSIGRLGWPTPRSTEAGHSTGNPERATDCKARLEDTVFLSDWPTPNASNGSGGGQAKRAGNPERSNELNDFVMLAGWATPQARDHFPAHTDEYVAAKMAEGHGMQNLNDQVTLSGWATPNVPNGGRISGNPDDIGKKRDGSKAQIGLENQARLTASGPGPIGYLLGPNGWEIHPASGQLNPVHSLWLQGCPDEYTACVLRVTRSWSRKRRRGSGA